MPRGISGLSVYIIKRILKKDGQAGQGVSCFLELWRFYKVLTLFRIPAVKRAPTDDATTGAFIYDAGVIDFTVVRGSPGQKVFAALHIKTARFILMYSSTSSRVRKSSPSNFV